MAKRKREAAATGNGGPPSIASKKPKKVQELASSTTTKTGSELPTIQIIAGSYDRILHGITATLAAAATTTTPAASTSSNKAAAKTGPAPETVSFADAFLFNAHSSAIRCLALSPASAPVPGQAQKVILATGSTDERINLYNLSAHPPSARARSAARELASAALPRAVVESGGNRELGTLLHHAAAVTQLAFPTRGKLLSAAEDSTVAVTRTRDWSLLSTVKAPVPKPVGRPSGDTAAHGATPRGVNAFAVHPSLKLMISVSKGERAMRLWNLVTGRKAGVLNFGREVLAQVGEGKHGTGEGRRVVWGSNADEGDEFAVAFDRDLLVFGMDSRPRCRVMSDLKTKVHAVTYLTLAAGGEDALLAVSTEDGRILFFSTRTDDLVKAAGGDEDGKQTQALPTAKLVAQLGGKDAGVSGRIKDFTALPVDGEDGKRVWYIITGSSDGRLRMWKLESGELQTTDNKEAGRQVGSLLGTYETQNRITCVAAFIMIPRPEGVDDSEDEEEEGESSGDDNGEGDDSDE